MNHMGWVSSGSSSKVRLSRKWASHGGHPTHMVPHAGGASFPVIAPSPASPQDYRVGPRCITPAPACGPSPAATVQLAAANSFIWPQTASASWLFNTTSIFSSTTLLALGELLLGCLSFGEILK